MRLLLPRALRNIKERTRWATGTVLEDGEVFAQDVVVKNSDSILFEQNKTVEPYTLIDDTIFTETVSGDDLDLSKIKHGLITVRTGAISSGNPTMQVKLQVKDSNDNYVDFLVLPTVSTASTSLFDDFYFLPFQTGRLIASYGGTGGFNNVTVELQSW